MTTFTPYTISFHPGDVTSVIPRVNSSVYESNDTSTNFTETFDEVEYYKNPQIVFLVFLFLLIVVGNAIVLAAIALSRERRRSRMNFFIMHLAICDLLTGPLVVLSDLIQKLTMYWYIGDALCRIHKFTQISVMYASTYMLVALSIDRLDAVARPMHFSGSWLRAKILVSTAWAFSILFAVPELVLFRVEPRFGGPMCIIHFTEGWQWQAYLTPIAVTLFVIPAIIICVCYVIIIFIIWRSSRLLQDNSGSRRQESNGSRRQENNSSRRRGKQTEEDLLNGRLSPRSGASRSSSRGIIPQAKIRTIKMTFLIVLVFIVCWSPYFVFNLCQVYGLVPDTKEWIKFNTFIQSMAPLNSAANPVIYGIFSTRICKYLRRIDLLRKMSERNCRCCHEESPGPTSTTEYTSVIETEDIRLNTDPRTAQQAASRVPLVKQRLSEADKVLLSMHVRTKSDEV